MSHSADSLIHNVIHSMHVVKNTCQSMRRVDPWAGRIPEENGSSLQFLCLENSVIKKPVATDHGVAKRIRRDRD